MPIAGVESTRQKGLKNVTADDFRRIALSLNAAQEDTHMGSPDFRVGRRIFAKGTLWRDSRAGRSRASELELFANWLDGEPEMPEEQAIPGRDRPQRGWNGA